MKIRALKVDGFGVWSELTLDELAGEMNVFCGPNEAGKTTLLQFVRAVLYGFSPERMRYLPPVHGGRPGGVVEIESEQGSFQVSRHADHTDPSGRAPAVLTASDGSRQPEPILKEILCGVDEKVFKNVFAFGLQEIQQLGSLGDTEAAKLLFSLSTGLDRVSLIDVMRELEVSRLRLLGEDGKSGRIVQLLADRDRVEREIEELGSLTADYSRLAAQRSNLDMEIGRLEEEKLRLQHETHCLEIAAAVRPRWAARAELETRLAGMQKCGPMPNDAVSRLQRIDSALEKRGAKISRISRRRRRLREEIAGIKINEELCRRSPQIEALREQENWLGTLENRCAELELDGEKIQQDLAAERENLGLPGDAFDFWYSLGYNPVYAADAAGRILPAFERRKLDGLRGQINSLGRRREELDEAKKAVAAAEETALDAQAKLEAELAPRGQTELAAAVEAAGEQVAQLHRRLQLDERYEQMARYRGELEAQTKNLLGLQVLPAWTLVGLGAVLVVGAILLVGGIFMSSSLTGGFGWLLSTIGLLGLIGGVAAKYFIERSNSMQLEASQKQLHMLGLQLEEAAQERNRLDERLPGKGGTPAERLAKAQSELAALEQLMPLDAQRQAALKEAEAAGQRAARAEEALSQARRRWRETLQAAGLPENLTPRQARLIQSRRGLLEELAARRRRAEEELKQRRDELQGISRRIEQMAADVGVASDGEPPARLLAKMLERLKQEQASAARRQTLRELAVRLLRLRTKQEQAMRRLKRRRRELFQQVGAVDEADFRRLAGLRASVESLEKNLAAARAEIAASLGDHCSESEIAAIVDNYDGESLEIRRQRGTKRLAEIAARLGEQFERRGRLAEKMNVAAADRRPAEKQLELATVKQRLKEAVRRWRVLALTVRVLHDIRLAYERDRQPAALQEASQYLRRLTRGRYTRVWTPLGEDVLKVDDAEQNSLPCEVLSRGTREQLFLSLRLALVTSYSRRGAKLPLVLDDVLVNFDTPRAKAAAAVLADFARAGHQLLVFTCHDHILKLFRSLDVRVSRLPGHTGRTEEAIDEDAEEDIPPREERVPAPPIDERPLATHRVKTPKKSKRKEKKKKQIPVAEEEPEEKIDFDESAVEDAETDDEFQWAEVWSDAEDDESEEFENAELDEESGENEGDVNDAA